MVGEERDGGELHCCHPFHDVLFLDAYAAQVLVWKEYVTEESQKSHVRHVGLKENNVVTVQSRHCLEQHRGLRDDVEPTYECAWGNENEKRAPHDKHPGKTDGPATGVCTAEDGDIFIHSANVVGKEYWGTLGTKIGNENCRCCQTQSVANEIDPRSTIRENWSPSESKVVGKE